MKVCAQPAITVPTFGALVQEQQHPSGNRTYLVIQASCVASMPSSCCCSCCCCCHSHACNRTIGVDVLLGILVKVSALSLLLNSGCRLSFCSTSEWTDRHVDILLIHEGRTTGTAGPHHSPEHFPGRDDSLKRPSIYQKKTSERCARRSWPTTELAKPSTAPKGLQAPAAVAAAIPCTKNK
jgi:hypothetical protein